MPPGIPALQDRTTKKLIIITSNNYLFSSILLPVPFHQGLVGIFNGWNAVLGLVFVVGRLGSETHSKESE